MSESEASKSSCSYNKENDICSLQEVLESEKQTNELANAVLGASDATNCSYDKGYVYRQALYSCITCMKANQSSINSSSSEEKELHGICLACSYECHQNHEIVELYTKRNFCCDCGNSKFKRNGDSAFKCNLQPNKESTNSLNKYNHNFLGLYCTCNRPYPEMEISSLLENSSSEKADEEHEEESSNTEMIQCTICEDWFHENHLLGIDKFLISNETSDDEVICHLCMFENKYLWSYQGHMPLKSDKASSVTTTTTTVNIEDEKSPYQHDQRTNTESSCFLKRVDAFNLREDKDLLEKSQCCVFLNGWREALCRCNDCMLRYKENKVEFLLSSEDTIAFYEECGNNKIREENIDENKLINDQLGKLDRIAQIDFLSNLNEFKKELTDFLAEFAKNSQVVKRENIEEFFEELKGRKKRKLNDNDVLSYHCK